MSGTPDQPDERPQRDDRERDERSGDDAEEGMQEADTANGERPPEGARS
jgi:hypothetical protein